MIDSGARAASWFLWIAPTGFLIFFAIPLLLWPLGWARWFRWRTEDAEVVLYALVGGVALWLRLGL